MSNLSWLRTVVVVGGGRWARVYITVLLKILPAHTRLLVYSPRNSQFVSNWIKRKCIEHRVAVSISLPVVHQRENAVVIVANAAADHFSAIEWSISKGIPVLAEKPFVLSSNEFDLLINSSFQQSVQLSSAHVFLFADYLYNFKNALRSLNNITSVSILWTDSLSESRHGEAKSFDPRVRIYEDCLPHILSILEIIQPGISPRFSSLQLYRGGAHLQLDFTTLNCVYSVCLIRNAKERRRLVTVNASETSLSLDFTHEPGIIFNSSDETSASPNWELSPKPITLMLNAFFDSVVSYQQDSRLSTSVSMRAICLSEDIHPFYDSCQAQWLATITSHSKENQQDMLYAVRELALTCHSSVSSLDEENLNSIIQSIRTICYDSHLRSQFVANTKAFIRSVLFSN